MATEFERQAMRRAIAISARGLGGTSPNPPVGCVVIQGGQIVGEGWHERKGEPHAETQALDRAGTDAAGGTAVVTLEPCNHAGLTPPCRQALLDAGVARVVIAVMDPTSRGDGGAAVLRQNGVDVETGVLEDEALLVLGTWLTALRLQRPIVTWMPLGPHHSDVIRSERRIHDAIIDTTSGDIAELGRHGKGMLTIRPCAGGEDPAEFLADLYSGGVRSLLLIGGGPIAETFVAADLVDRVLLCNDVLVPPGLVLKDVRPGDVNVVVEARRARAGR